MTNEQKVGVFMRQAGQEVRDTPGWPCDQVVTLRLDLIGEEVCELAAAVLDRDMVGVADAIGDVLYVVYGMAVAFGIPAQEVFDEVHRSNMSKFIDGHRREDGKWVKGPSYSPPRLKRLLDSKAQRNRPSRD